MSEQAENQETTSAIRALRKENAALMYELTIVKQRADDSDAVIAANIMHWAHIRVLDGLAHRLVDLLRADMTAEESGAVWILVQYVKRQQSIEAMKGEAATDA